MTNAEMKTIMAKSGVSTEVVNKISDKFDFEKINEIIEGANEPEAAINAIHDFYPELEISKLQEQLDFVHGQFEKAYEEQKSKEPVELTENELDHVSGGGFSDWWNNLGKGWKVALTVAAVIVGTTLVCTGIGALGGAAAGALGVGAGVAGEAAYGAVLTGTIGFIGSSVVTGLTEAALGGYSF